MERLSSRMQGHGFQPLRQRGCDVLTAVQHGFDGGRQFLRRGILRDIGRGTALERPDGILLLGMETEDDNRLAPRHYGIAGEEGPTERGPHAQHLKVVSRNQLPPKDATVQARLYIVNGRNL